MLSTTDELIAEMTNRIVRAFRPVKVVLFGSYARGQAGPHSDVDLLVVLPRVENKRRALVELLSLFSDLPVPADVVVTTPDEIALRGDVIGTVLRPALREGKVLHEGER